jgi:hypothetical protein
LTESAKERLHFVWEFLCTTCFEEWETDWFLGDNVTCARCGTVYEAVWEVNTAGAIIGPWLGKVLREPMEKPEST